MFVAFSSVDSHALLELEETWVRIATDTSMLPCVYGQACVHGSPINSEVILQQMCT